MIIDQTQTVMCNSQGSYIRVLVINCLTQICQSFHITANIFVVQLLIRHCFATSCLNLPTPNIHQSLYMSVSLPSLLGLCDC